jgi:hypothetical protein
MGDRPRVGPPPHLNLNHLSTHWPWVFSFALVVVITLLYSMRSISDHIGPYVVIPTYYVVNRIRYTFPDPVIDIYTGLYVWLAWLAYGVMFHAPLLSISATWGVVPSLLLVGFGGAALAPYTAATPSMVWGCMMGVVVVLLFPHHGNLALHMTPLSALASALGFYITYVFAAFASVCSPSGAGVPSVASALVMTHTAEHIPYGMARIYRGLLDRQELLILQTVWVLYVSPLWLPVTVVWCGYYCRRIREGLAAGNAYHLVHHSDTDMDRLEMGMGAGSQPPGSVAASSGYHPTGAWVTRVTPGGSQYTTQGPQGPQGSQGSQGPHGPHDPQSHRGGHPSQQGAPSDASSVYRHRRSHRAHTPTYTSEVAPLTKSSLRAHTSSRADSTAPPAAITSHKSSAPGVGGSRGHPDPRARERSVRRDKTGLAEDTHAGASDGDISDATPEPVGSHRDSSSESSGPVFSEHDPDPAPPPRGNARPVRRAGPPVPVQDGPSESEDIFTESGTSDHDAPPPTPRRLPPAKAAPAAVADPDASDSDGRLSVRSMRSVRSNKSTRSTRSTRGRRSAVPVPVSYTGPEAAAGAIPVQMTPYANPPDEFGGLSAYHYD